MCRGYESGDYIASHHSKQMESSQMGVTLPSISVLIYGSRHCAHSSDEEFSLSQDENTVAERREKLSNRVRPCVVEQVQNQQSADCVNW